MSDIEELSTLIALIYECVETPESWQTTLKAISRFLSVKDVSLGSNDFSTGRFEAFHLPIDPDFVRSYAEVWSSRNFLWKVSSKLPVGQLFSFETAMPRGEFSRTGLYNEWFKPQGMDKALGANLLVEGPLLPFRSIALLPTRISQVTTLHAFARCSHTSSGQCDCAMS